MASIGFFAPVYANQAPQLAPIPDQTVTPGQAFVYRLVAQDADNTVPAIIMRNAPRDARLVGNGDGSRTFYWTPTSQSPAQTVVIFQAIDAQDAALISTQRMVLNSLGVSTTDSAGETTTNETASNEASETSTSSANTQADGSALSLPDIAPQNLRVGQRVQLFVKPRDSDRSVPWLVANNLPQGATLNDAFDGSRLFEWTPSSSQLGETTVVFVAMDAQDQAIRIEQAVVFNVTGGSESSSSQSTNSDSSETTVDSTAPNTTAPNTAVANAYIETVATQIVNVGQHVSFKIKAHLPDGSAAVLHIDRLPENASFDDNGDGTRTFNWQTNNADQGEHRFRFTALHSSQSNVRASTEVSIIIGDPSATGSEPASLGNADDVPLFVPVQAQRVVAKQDLRFRVEAKSKSGRVPTLMLINAPDNVRFDDNHDGSREFLWTPSLAQVGEHSLQVLAVDDEDARLRTSMTINISVLGGGESSSEQSPPPDASTQRAEDRAAASRFLQRATFGPTTQAIDNLMSKSYGDWIVEQQNLPQTRYLDWLDAQLREYGLFNILDGRKQFERQQLRTDVFWNLAVNAPDQLRQRVAFALSQIVVVSDKDSGIDNRVRGIANYHDLLAKHAFGHYRDLLLDVTLNPMMGDFLSMRRNEKPDVANNIQSDENYAREFMQLFTVGTIKLQMNGQAVLDANGQTVATYVPDEVTALARVFTGWNYGDAGSMRSSERTIHSDIIPMKAFEAFHDKNKKAIIGGVKLSANQSAMADLITAIDTIFVHPNVAPNIASRLIKSLVTSNPSPEYIERVARVFENNGHGVRGDLKSVITAILLDSEALNGHANNPWVFGKIKEPIVKITALWRAFDAKGAFNRYRYSDVNNDFLQRPYSSPSVFNFFSPNYKPPGQVAREGKLAPEAQILHDTTVLRGADRLFDYAHAVPLGQTALSNQHAMFLNIEAEKPLANDVPKLVDALSNKLLAGKISDSLRNTLIELGNTTPNIYNGEQRVRELLFVLLLSPEYAVQR